MRSHWATPNIDALMKGVSDNVDASGEICCGPPDADGATRGGTSEYWRGTHCISGADAHYEIHQDRGLLQTSALTGAVEYAKRHDSALHLSSGVHGGVHSHWIISVRW